MALNTLEIIALIFAIGVILKLVIVSISGKSWMNFAKAVYKKPMILMLVEFILALIVFYYLLQSMSIVQMMGGLVLGALLTGMTFAAYGKEFMSVANKMLKGNMFKRAWLPILVWLIIAVWVLKEIFM